MSNMKNVEGGEIRNMVVLHPPQEMVRRYPKNKPMSTHHRFQNRDGKKKIQHYKEKRRAPIPVVGTPSIWNYCPGNPQCVLPPRPKPTTTTPRVTWSKPQTTTTLKYKKSEMGTYNTLITESVLIPSPTTGHSEVTPTTQARTSAQRQQGTVRIMEDPVLTFNPG